MKNAFYLAKSTSQSNGDLKGDIAKERRRDQFGDRDSAIKDGFTKPLQTASVSVCLALSSVWRFFMHHLLEYNMGNFPVKQKQK